MNDIEALIERREKLKLELIGVRERINTLKAIDGPRPIEGQRIRLYRNFTRAAPRDDRGRYIEGVFCVKGGKPCVVCDDGSYAIFKVVGNRKDKHPGWQPV